MRTSESNGTGIYAGLLLALVVIPGVAVADVGNAVTIADGLANPRGIAFAPNGALYVAESGKGGAGPPCTPSPPNPTVNRCYGETGAVTRIVPGVGVQRIVTGLPSMVLETGAAEGGPVDVAFLGTAGYVTMSWGGDPENPAHARRARLAVRADAALHAVRTDQGRRRRGGA